MKRYRCNICNVYEYEDTRGDSVTEIKPGIKPEDFPDDWKCPSANQIKPIRSLYKRK
jgi:rubredoxin